jgi:hypothetical protein
LRHLWHAQSAAKNPIDNAHRSRKFSRGTQFFSRLRTRSVGREIFRQAAVAAYWTRVSSVIYLICRTREHKEGLL